MNRILSVALLLATCLLTTASAQRVDNRAVRERAATFREAVLEFERTVVSVRGIDRADERVVDRFEEATKRVVLAAKNPRQISRLKTEYRKMLALQDAALNAIFRKYTPHHGLIQAWDAVEYFQYQLEEELAFYTISPRHGNRVTKRVTSTASATSSR